MKVYRFNCRFSVKGKLIFLLIKLPMKNTKSSIIFILALTCLFQLYSCKKNNHSGCYSAKVIHLGKGSVDPCQSDIAVLNTEVEGIPIGTNVALISNLTDLNLKDNQTIYFKLHMRSEIVPGILRGCTLDPKHMFQIDLCE